MALGAAPVLQFRHWPWIALALAAPVVIGLGAPVHRAVWAALRRGEVGAQALASAAPLAALGWSVHMLLVGGAGGAGFSQSPGARTLALDVAAVLTVLALAAAPTGRRPDPGPADRVGIVLGLFVPAVAVAVLGAGIGAGDPTAGFARATAVLVAGSPCALLLATPLVRRAAAVRRAGLRATGTPLRRVDTVVLTDPGTLFSGEVAVRAVHVVDGADPDEVRRLAAALCVAHPTDPLARAVVEAAGSTPLPSLSDPAGTPDTGVRGVVSELRESVVLAHAVLVGPADWLVEHGVDPPAQAGLFVAWDGVVRGRLDVADVAAPGTDAALERLRRRGVTVLRPAPDPTGQLRRLRRRGAVVAAVGVPTVGHAAVGHTAVGHAAGPADLVLTASEPGTVPDMPAVADAVRRAHRAVATLWIDVGIAAAAAVAGVGLAATGAVTPACAVAIPLGAAAAVVLHCATVAPMRLPRRSPIGATAG